MHQAAYDRAVPVIVPQRHTVKMNTSLTLNDMLVTIGRAYLASDQYSAVSDIRQLSYPRLAQEFAWAVAYLSSKGLLTETEELKVSRWAGDLLDGTFS